ncbi:response regulator [Mucilaginibacter sp.]|uniref:response regulator n=1 Tax=Mucilaginibacter sp. TaxID=1882438 RepID=UPI002607B139|nr:response regulator [Mucilaginibacter sp.]MDB4919279.1 two-component system response regulator [Mucilaginibacter sp.]
MNNNEIEIEVLLVEDNVHDAELTIRSLKKVNLANKLFHVKDGAEALDFIFAKGDFAGRNMGSRPKLILLDIKMPKIDGIEVLRQIKLNEATKTIPVVMMTSSKEEQDIISSYNLGVNSYVVKPVEFEGFVKAVCELGLYWLITNQQIQ